MVKEIERKFLVSGDGWRDLIEADIRIRQFYLVAAPDRSVRVRISDGASAKLTLKFGSKARERDEFEYPILLADAEEMLAFAIGRVIEKTRHHVRHRGHLYEVDVFGGMLSGLVVAELETPRDVQGEMLPDWLGREVTGEHRFYNASLALEGIPEIAA
ncbi:CYTH domain-containing protein [Mesorhizobium sp.]|uniref:CYTH domain-containing protein n=1 Tax=Mesorhizobium sp. TaxID=1871066 RepID=UPI000FE9DCF6|nr:CYTH domain-containing protein [Mesorhizobium sp.]RWO23043.1 MAG: CYTH domain-containing protein [Mesorhizobium sp.]